MARDKICTPFLALSSPENKFTVSTIEDMQSRKYLKIGDIVELNGYYTAGDGAHHKRKIESADDGSGVQLANGLWANIVHSGEVNVSWFGMSQDLDFYYFLQKISKYCSIENSVNCLSFKGVEYFTKKYSINRNTEWSIKNDIVDIVFDCTNRTNKILNIKGNGTILRYTGVFERFYEYDIGVNKGYSARGNFDIRFIGVNNSYVSDFRIDGGAGTFVTKRENTVDGVTSLPTEGGVQHYCFVVAGCKKITFSRCSFNYSACDGMYITGAETSTGLKIYSEDILIDNCDFSNNGRQGISAVGYKNLTVTNCIFENIGRVVGYGGHSPSAGIDFEKEYSATDMNFGGFFVGNNIFKNSGWCIATPSDKEGEFYRNIVTDCRLSGCREISNNFFKNSSITTDYGGSYKGIDTMFFKDNSIYFDESFKDGYKLAVSVGAFKTLVFQNNIFSMKFPEEYNNSSVTDKYWFYSLSSQVLLVKNNVFDFGNPIGFQGFFLAATFNHGTSASDCIEYRIEDNFFKRLIPEDGDKNSVPYLNVGVYNTSSSKIYIKRNNRTNSSFLGVYDNIGKDTDSTVLKFDYSICLNTPYHTAKMQQEGVYEDFIQYMDSKTEYDRVQREQPEGVMMLPVIEEPQPSEALLKFKEKYLG